MLRQPATARATGEGPEKLRRGEQSHGRTPRIGGRHPRDHRRLHRLQDIEQAEKQPKAKGQGPNLVGDKGDQRLDSAQSEHRTEQDCAQPAAPFGDHDEGHHRQYAAQNHRQVDLPVVIQRPTAGDQLTRHHLKQRGQAGVQGEGPHAQPPKIGVTNQPPQRRHKRLKNTKPQTEK